MNYREFISSHDVTQVAFINLSLQKPGLDIGLVHVQFLVSKVT
jgi:hypothetical protein